MNEPDHTALRKTASYEAEPGEVGRVRLRALPGVAEVRARGLMLAADCADADAAEVVERALLEQRLVINATEPRTLRFLPPLVIAEAEVDAALQRLSGARTD